MGGFQSWRRLSAHRRGAQNLVSDAAFPWTMLRDCSVSHAGPSTTGFARVDCRPFARSAGRNAFCSTRSRIHATAGPLSEPRGRFSGSLLLPFIPMLRRALKLRGASFATGLVFLLAIAAAPAFAAGHRARMSADLNDQLAAASSSIDVIVHGTRAEVDALAQRYNVRVKRYMKSGVVFRVTAGQLAALQQDETQDHLSADVPIHSIADVTAQTIGADQVWAGSERLPPLSGQGVGVA